MKTSPLLRLICISALFYFSIYRVVAQGSLPNSYANLNDFAERLVEPLEKLGAKKVNVLDLETSSGLHPGGARLADQIASALHSKLPGIQFLSSTSIAANLSANQPEPNEKLDEIIPPDARISGKFGRVGAELEISLKLKPADNRLPVSGPVTGRIPIPQELLSSTIPAPPPPEQIQRPDWISAIERVPRCIDCPAPPYTAEARHAKFEGMVVLLVSVSEKGKVTNAVVKKGVGMGMDEVAVETVRNWKFKPAIGPDGKPIAVSLPIEISFRLFGK